MVKRYAFTMIELIFAIVVMSIVVISVPMLMRTNSNAMRANVAQEAIFAASAQTMQILSYPWDTDSNGSHGSYNKIVAIPNGTTAYNRYYNSQNIYDTNGSFRVGAILENGHRRFKNYNDIDANISGITPVNPNLLCQTTTISSFINPNPTASGYKDNYETITNVSYISDNTNAPFVFSSISQVAPTNIKLVEVVIKNLTTNANVVRLRSYTVNIGETSFASRRY